MTHDQIKEALQSIVENYGSRDRTRPLTSAQASRAWDMMHKFEFFEYSVSQFGNLLLIGYEHCAVIGREGRVSAQWSTVAQTSFVGTVDARRFIEW
jgi:hypothetical protein